ncbi:MAG: hypothetical protein AAGD09_24265 [Cyanobacteria bacterium P01_F01_bin.56]
MRLPLRLDDSQREDDDYTLYKQLIRDVCYLFHELSLYRGIMGDLNYSEDYPRPYWLLINRVNTGQEDDRMIRSGILILFMAMLDGAFDGGSAWLIQHQDAIAKALSSFVPEDSDMLRLGEAVLHGLSLLNAGCQPDDRFKEDSGWAYEQFVRQYFARSAM